MAPGQPKQWNLGNSIYKRYGCEAGWVALLAAPRPAQYNKLTLLFHTTLALIYVARGTWEAAPSTPGYMSAWYQLQAVLDDAGRREKSEHFFQPLPEIKGMLAKTLTHIPRRKNEAGPMYFRAALA